MFFHTREDPNRPPAFGAIASDNKLALIYRIMLLSEEHCSRNYFSLCTSMTSHSGTGLHRSGSDPNQYKIVPM